MPLAAPHNAVHPTLAAILAGVTCHGVTPGLADGVLAPMSAEALVALIADLRRDDAALRRVGAVSYLHANGFYKLPIYDDAVGLRVRLHFWPGDSSAAEHIHGHRWHMASRVFLGALHSERWDAAPDEAGDWDGFRYDKRGGEATVRPLGCHRARCTVTQIHHAGAAYHMVAGDLHRIVQPPGAPALTLMVQSAPLSTHNFMLARGAPDVAVRPLGAAAVGELLGAIAHRLEEEL